MESIEWKIKPTNDLEQREGKYFLQTNMSTLDGLACWEFYNQIRDIECANRQLKTDLELRPIYHQTDDRAESHIFMGLLSYTIINTIRYQLKGVGENCFWTEIVRRMSPQRMTTTRGLNPYGEEIALCKCSQPTAQGKAIYQALKYKERPFVRSRIISPPKKICSTFSESKKNEVGISQGITTS